MKSRADTEQYSTLGASCFLHIHFRHNIHLTFYWYWFSCYKCLGFRWILLWKLKKMNKRMEKKWKKKYGFRISCPVQERIYNKVNATHYIDSDEIMNCDNGLNMYNFNTKKKTLTILTFFLLFCFGWKNMNPVKNKKKFP